MKKLIRKDKRALHNGATLEARTAWLELVRQHAQTICSEETSEKLGQLDHIGDG